MLRKILELLRVAWLDRLLRVAYFECAASRRPNCCRFAAAAASFTQCALNRPSMMKFQALYRSFLSLCGAVNHKSPSAVVYDAGAGALRNFDSKYFTSSSVQSKFSTRLATIVCRNEFRRLSRQASLRETIWEDSPLSPRNMKFEA